MNTCSECGKEAKSGSITGKKNGKTVTLCFKGPENPGCADKYKLKKDEATNVFIKR